jgi:hypothetical protein
MRLNQLKPRPRNQGVHLGQKRPHGVILPFALHHASEANLH